MSIRVRSALSTAILLAIVLLLEAYGLRSGTTGIVLVAMVGAIALGVVCFRVDLRWAGVGAAVAAAFTLTWNGWYVGPLRPGDILVLVSLLCFLLADPNGAFRTPPWWVKQLAIVVVLIVAIQIYFPPDPVYLSQRIVLNATGQPTASTSGSLLSANLGVAFKFIVAVVATPMVFTAAALVERRAVRWLAAAFATGAGVSGLVALADHFGTDLGRIVTGIPNVGSRQLGFSDHPNFLAAGLTLAAPLAFWLLPSRSRFERLVGAAALLGCVGGVFASGSRGGAVCIVVVLAISVLLHERTRGYAPMIGLAAVLVVGIIIAFVPSVGATLLRVTRLGGGTATAGSDSVRAIVGAQGVRDFHHSPISGIGLQVSFDASQVYLQELASGGLILFSAVSVYMLGAIITAFRRMREPLVAALLAALLITLALNVFEADLTDRFYYVPAAILIARVLTAREDAREHNGVVDEHPALAVT
ncbi:MAG: O-antigen ligase family protein [Jatrophihabitantaceae bacterium]